MLEKPDLPDERLLACLQAAYGLPIVQLTFLALGADPNSAVYRAIAEDATAYFVKLRSGDFDQASVRLPSWLSGQGSAHIIAALPTTAGQLWAQLDRFTVILYPFVVGQNAYAVALSDDHWRDFGATLKRLHTANVPPTLMRQIPRETFSAQARNSVTMLLSQLDHRFDDPIAQTLAAFLKTKRAATLDLVERAERLARTLQAHTPAYVVCHADAHAGNILIDQNDALYIVDWDTLLLAPKERDLMFVGGGQGFIGHSAQEEIALFYQGYGQTPIDAAALAYYRYERIIQDIAIYCEELLLTTAGGEDRPQALEYLMSNFLPNSTIAIAYAADTTQLSQQDAAR